MSDPRESGAEKASIMHLVAMGVTKPLPLYSHATVHNGIVYLSGVQGFIPGTFEFPAPDAGAQATQVFRNMQTILEQCKSDLSQVLKVTVLLVDLGDFAPVNEAFNAAFPSEPPARSTLAVKDLPRGARVIVEAIASQR